MVVGPSNPHGSLSGASSSRLSTSPHLLSAQNIKFQRAITLYLPSWFHLQLNVYWHTSPHPETIPSRSTHSLRCDIRLRRRYFKLLSVCTSIYVEYLSWRSPLVTVDYSGNLLKLWVGGCWMVCRGLSKCQMLVIVVWHSRATIKQDMFWDILIVTPRIRSSS